MKMEKLVTICRNNDFRRIYARGKSYVTPLVVVYVLKNRTKNVRVGITTSKKIGNAVQRKPLPPGDSGGVPPFGALGAARL